MEFEENLGPVDGVLRLTLDEISFYTFCVKVMLLIKMKQKDKGSNTLGGKEEVMHRTIERTKKQTRDEVPQAKQKLGQGQSPSVLKEAARARTRHKK